MIGRILRAPGVLLWILGQILRAAAAVCRAALSPARIGPPVIVRVPLTGRSDLQVTAFSWAITVTPGTLVVAIGEDSLWVHCVLGGEREELLAEFAEMERRLLTVLGPPSSSRDSDATEHKDKEGRP